MGIAFPYLLTITSKQYVLIIIKAGVIDFEEFLANSNLTEEEKAKKRKKFKLYQQYKEMAEAMGPGTTVAEIRENMKKMLNKVLFLQS